jgi:hypothetical protein
MNNYNRNMETITIRFKYFSRSHSMKICKVFFEQKEKESSFSIINPIVILNQHFI